ncbi:phosphoribosyl-AMP cyclohydrolase [Parasphingorhabdus sp.]|jgi:phosphoribosyl-AMP cyclohydrolase|uniref:phosphoribosyl-AMP cyclohydrolase n=1 Tax=Parasphingorhabdus sp. TaxID=2709688 RepID=UPI0007F423DA|nr:phosphoribosyl-AMP cyclohydrolase [Sphingomonadales bacterium EhC05]
MTDPLNHDRETGTTLQPKYDSNGLMTAVVTDESSGDLLMVAYMNEAALDLTIKTQVAHFFSRSRQSLWKKGETSGHILEISEMRIDCDQDAIWIKAKPAGPTCHTGQTSCFYRRIADGGLEPVE